MYGEGVVNYSFDLDGNYTHYEVGLSLHAEPDLAELVRNDIVVINIIIRDFTELPSEVILGLKLYFLGEFVFQKKSNHLEVCYQIRTTAFHLEKVACDLIDVKFENRYWMVEELDKGVRSYGAYRKKLMKEYGAKV